MPAAVPQLGIVGASRAGFHAASEARRRGFEGRILVVGEETHGPYDRPPLTKEIARGDWPGSQASLALRAELGIEWMLGVPAVGLEVAERTVELADGRRERCEAGVVIATGARPRALPGSEGLGGVLTIRTLEDGLALARRLAAGPRRVGVVGAGFLGAEVAASCRGKGLEVTLIESAPAPLVAALGPELGAATLELHRRHGVDVRTAVGVAGIEADGERRARRLLLDDGSAVEVDLVVAAIGVTPCVEWLRGSGLDLEDGVLCDETCLAAPGVAAAGDVARWPNRRFGECRRIEHWDNAIRQGEHVAARLLAAPGSEEESAPYEPIPWFWSDQYGLKLQMVGSARGFDEIAVVSGSLPGGDLLALYRRGAELVAACGVSRAREIVRCRRLLEARATWAEALAELSAAASG